MQSRDIDAARADTLHAIQLMTKFNAAIWTLENVCELHQFFKGKYPTARVFKMRPDEPSVPAPQRSLLLPVLLLRELRLEAVALLALPECESERRRLELFAVRART